MGVVIWMGRGGGRYGVLFLSFDFCKVLHGIAFYVIDCTICLIN